MLNILIDENIALAKEVFSNFGNVKLIPGQDINSSKVKKVDILIVRSITKVDEHLLERSNVKFVGSATIGTDHLDLDYLKENNIYFCNAPGSNSYSVAEYVITAILNLAVQYDFKLKDKSIGIIGVGNIGSKVEKFAKAFGMNVLLNDPPLKDKTSNKKYLNLENILKADIITLHVPYTKVGKYKTHHLINKDILQNIKEGTILINTSRGPVTDNTSLINILDNKKIIAVLDVWENEPNINLELLQKTDIGTPHIAGYSLDGKINGTKVIFKELANYLGKVSDWKHLLSGISSNILSLDNHLKLENALHKLIKNSYDIAKDHHNLLGLIKQETSFDKLRKNYAIRREFNNYKIINDGFSDYIKNILSTLRFKLIEPKDI